MGTASEKETEPQFGTDFYQKQPMNLPLSKDHVKEIWGSKYAEVRDAAAGDLILWRYDIGAKDNYKFEADNDSIDMEGLKNKKVSGQLFIPGTKKKNYWTLRIIFSQTALSMSIKWRANLKNANKSFRHNGFNQKLYWPIRGKGLKSGFFLFYCVPDIKRFYV
ncbi:hypothetical protein ABU162_15700 [Paenibacillus thiaminolyticus]|uniref:hypothetical protein n=1 Tax=Paenibacillus thiaminolyticus TaxID=49283 RepID=UPI0035A6C16F